MFSSPGLEEEGKRFTTEGEGSREKSSPRIVKERGWPFFNK